MSGKAIVTKTEKFFEAILESAPDAMIIVDDEGRIAIVNGEALRMFGYAREEMLGQSIEMLIPDRAREAHIGERTRFLRSPRLRRMGVGKDLNGRRSDGHEFPVEISLSPVTTEEGLYVSSAIRDISERKLLEKEIIAARHAAERANKANRAFLAAASHDLRQPVQALSLVNGALRRTVTDPKVLEMIEVQELSLTGMTNLLNSLLDISRLDAGVITPRVERFSVAMIFDRLRAEFTRQAAQKDLVFEAKAAEEFIESDPNLLVEIIQNLVSNAIRYTEAGSVSLCCERRGSMCEIQVIDTGIGIEADEVDAIFDEFHQCNPTSSHKEGFGLGLAIVRRLSDLLGHQVTVDSVPHRGSRFSVAVPRAASLVTADAVSKSKSVDEPMQAQVLLVEDDSQVAQALRMLLESVGHSVVLAASKEEALNVVRTTAHRPDLIISDYHLLGTDNGVETILAVREVLAEEIPAFIVSGDTSTLVEEARAIPGCILMSKPVDVDQLLDHAQAAIVAAAPAQN